MIIKRKRKRINNINELKNSNYRKIRIKKKNKIYSIKKYIPKFKYIAILLIALYLTILNICRKSNYLFFLEKPLSITITIFLNLKIRPYQFILFTFCLSYEYS